MISAVIADDEPLARERIRTLLGAFPEVAVVGEARDANEALAKVRELQPSLLFLDVQMPEGDGFSVLEKLSPAATPAVIFVTAYDAFALRAFEVHAVDYLLKPFTRARFSRAISHVLTKLAQPARNDGFRANCCGSGSTSMGRNMALEDPISIEIHRTSRPWTATLSQLC